MLSDQERSHIDQELARLPTRRAACIDALMVVQRSRGYVDDDGLADIADYLGMSEGELDSVASFYNHVFRRPVGSHVILLCDSVSCWICGSERLHDAIGERLGIDYGQTTADGRFTLLPMACLGACERAPALMIDEELFGEVAPERLDAILAGVPAAARRPDGDPGRDGER